MASAVERALAGMLATRRPVTAAEVAAVVEGQLHRRDRGPEPVAGEILFPHVGLDGAPL
ncbi:hypothetical protein [Nocardia brasiliensis]|uniref:hypothetical protein n=1 Tax=Nocardia brasiliensis TaxID=37326 RepID=UPI0024560BA8|nr:hypothetical protein [Nocardia brasiliensis]